jgi:hypothetical protein
MISSSKFAIYITFNRNIWSCIRHSQVALSVHSQYILKLHPLAHTHFSYMKQFSSNVCHNFSPSPLYIAVA